jgi:hypothetical protein
VCNESYSYLLFCVTEHHSHKVCVKTMCRCKVGLIVYTWENTHTHTHTQTQTHTHTHSEREGERVRLRCLSVYTCNCKHSLLSLVYVLEVWKHSSGKKTEERGQDAHNIPEDQVGRADTQNARVRNRLTMEAMVGVNDVIRDCLSWSTGISVPQQKPTREPLS